jgi:hypothetical protein
MWNTDPQYVWTQSLYGCSYHYWYVIVTMNYQGGACKSYPNAHKDYIPPVPLSSFTTLTCDFTESSPHDPGMVYEAAFDIWTNGVANDSCTEFMIWNENVWQSPGGNRRTNVILDGHTYTPVVRVQGNGQSGYLGFLAVPAFQSGTVNILTFFNYAVAQRWLPTGSVLNQLDYGFELVSTNNVPRTFVVSNFQIHEN